MNINLLTDEVLYVLIGIVAVLIISTFITKIMKQKNNTSGLKEVEMRIRSWWVMFIIFTFALLIHSTISLIFMALLCFLALKEYFSLIPFNRSHRLVLFWAYMTIPIQFLLIYLGWYGMFIVFIPVYMFLLIPIQAIIVGETKNFLRSIATVQWGVMLMVFGLSHLAFLLVLPGQEESIAGAGLVLFLVVLTQANDVAQFLWGKMLGKKKIVPKVSPNKTWAGFIGGVLTTTVLAVILAPLITPFSLFSSIIAGLYIGLTGFIGVVNISALKRDLNIKDTSAIIPGHGGILDRVDSLTYTAPLFFHFTRYFYF
ncbi:Phosphatidate cytidylyltransferase [Jeotgalicoccus aerolatus]|uniref:Phosphatidate cytidylyltransferase n=1 Tax=Jeotgalicoccus aerolatus TaxID=709510 RepID=A0ABS4HPU0_9STAP|nr:phosphatidate cytidylyltransferase [Jeotgalicoccus aerolatus]MBP1952843.1 phosphatidate cytidylyltransferase [Jeotgalicoccus aerolatus]GGE07617.1 phosphatidate cytidylyltransferase [Jeotgalicoccus aerolatus]CAD2080529.1 Phosphatidate cytidylyltransferase [Jeotgalicoccus aerolatus]